MAPVSEYDLFIDGKFCGSDDRYEQAYPYTGEFVARIARASAAQADAAITAAVRAFDDTRRWSRARRAELLTAIARGIAERRADFERAIVYCTGKPIGYARAEVARTVGVFTLAAEEAKRFGRRALTLRRVARIFASRQPAARKQGLPWQANKGGGFTRICFPRSESDRCNCPTASRWRRCTPHPVRPTVWSPSARSIITGRAPRPVWR